MSSTLCDDLITDDLRQVEFLLQQELHSDAPFVDQLLGYVASLGGKRLRPQLLLLSGHAAGGTTAHHTTLATVMEMIHLATLLHDDVLDAAEMRRHRPTTCHLWGNHASILLGDHLFSRAFFLASSVGDTFACRTIGRSTNIVCEGELRQVGTQGVADLTEQEYLQIIGAKTAELCGCCCLLGAHYAGADPTQCRQLQSFGYELGLAFQIADDLLDISGDARQTGKTAGGDLRDKKLTLPLIHCLSEAHAQERRWLLDQWHDSSDIDRQELLRLLRRTNSLSYARDFALRIIERARGHLATIPHSLARSVLDHLAALVVTRRH